MILKGTVKQIKNSNPEQLELRIGTETYILSTLDILKTIEFETHVANVYMKNKPLPKQPQYGLPQIVFKNGKPILLEDHFG